MVESQPEELVAAKELMRGGKYEEALGTIKDFEKKSGISEEDKLSALILEGKLYFYIGNYKKSAEVGEHAYNLSQEVGNVSGTIEALFHKSNLIRHDNTLKFIL